MPPMQRHSVDAAVLQAMMQRLGKWHAPIKPTALMRRLHAGEYAAASCGLLPWHDDHVSAGKCMTDSLMDDR